MNLIPLLIISFAIMVNFCIACHRRRVMWQQRTNIGDAANWEDEKIPCASDALLFPEKSYDLIKLSNFTMKEIILPKTGGFILDTQTSLKFRENDSKCLHSNEIKAYKSVIESPWLSSSNWQTTHINEIESTINAATPHDERIPCDRDEIIFPINNSYVVDFQSIPMLVFESIVIDGRIMKPNEFKEFLYSSIVGQSSFKNFDNTQFLNNECHEQTCVCHQKGESLRQQLCENERPFCQPTPHCSDPVKPLGHCCRICGAVFQMKLNSANFNLDGFKSEIEKAINAATSETDRKKVIYHCSVTLGKENEKNQHYLQLIIVDRFEYKELSSNLMEQLRESMLNKISQSQSKFYFISGTAFTPNASGHVFTFIFGSLFFVTLFMTLIYIVYYDDRHIPRLMAAIRNQRRFMHHSNVIFARFDNTSHANENVTTNDDDYDGNSVVEVDLHFGTDQSIENVNRAFNNPMFDAKEMTVDDDDGIKEEKL